MCDHAPGERNEPLQVAGSLTARELAGLVEERGGVLPGFINPIEIRQGAQTVDLEEDILCPPRTFETSLEMALCIAHHPQIRIEVSQADEHDRFGMQVPDLARLLKRLEEDLARLLVLPLVVMTDANVVLELRDPPAVAELLQDGKGPAVMFVRFQRVSHPARRGSKPLEQD